MGSISLPYMNAYGQISKVFDKIKSAGTPEKFTYDFLATKLGFKSSSVRAIIPLLRKIDFLTADGSPTDAYRDFRSDQTRGLATAISIKEAYSELFEANEFAYELGISELEDIIIRLTGLEKGNATARCIAETFKVLCDYADFDAEDKPVQKPPKDEPQPSNLTSGYAAIPSHSGPEAQALGMNIGYTINLNLPETKDPEVFEAIFTALREKLLS